MKGLFVLLAVAVAIALNFFHPPLAQSAQCDKSYPGICIPTPPPDLDCKDVPYKNFKVLQPDPHKFDRDKDGIGCESKKR